MRLQTPAQLTISPDKWLATHPLDFHLQAKTVRSVNFFTSSAAIKLDRLDVAGFFNPTLDLSGADAEADVMAALLPGANIIRREAASKTALGSVAGANVIHLSMHGAFNEADPTQSKLVFAGAANDDRIGDPNALYATEMAQVAALRNRDLVFAAACQTGLQAADRTNISELTGILRPLTANRNKNLILSLWNVSDRATAEFVQTFYQRLAGTRDVKDAFHHAQDHLRAQNPNPYYWAAFYLSQAK
jgi:CHAT domain-containing protein